MELRGEIVALHKSRADLFKWKLIMVAGLGATASGLVGTNRFPRPGFLLALIPLVSLYVDLLCLDLTLRVVVIAKYFQLLADEKKEHNENSGKYESFVTQATAMDSAFWQSVKYAFTFWKWKKAISAYAFFAWAQYLSTVLFAVGAAVWGFALCIPRSDEWISMTGAAIGLLGSGLFYLAYANRFRAIQRLKLDQGVVPRQ